MRFLKRLTKTPALAIGLVVAGLAGGGVAEELSDAQASAQANNPLAAFNTFNLQNQYTGKLTGSDDTANTFYLRDALPVTAFGSEWLVRATLPINRFPTATGNKTGVGDFNVFAAYLIDTGQRQQQPASRVSDQCHALQA